RARGPTLPGPARPDAARPPARGPRRAGVFTSWAAPSRRCGRWRVDPEAATPRPERGDPPAVAAALLVRGRLDEGNRRSRGHRAGGVQESDREVGVLQPGAGGRSRLRLALRLRGQRPPRMEAQAASG